MSIAKLPETTPHNAQTVQAPSKHDFEDSTTSTVTRSTARLAVNNRRYWEGRLYHESYVRDGRKFEVPEYYVKLNHAGKRRAFNLGNANKVVAAEKALEIAMYLARFDWQATVEKYAPSAARTNHAPTVGEFLAEVKRTAHLKDRTLHRYAMYLRSIVAQVAGIVDKVGARYNYRTGGHAEWVAKVDGTPLDRLTPEASADWKAAYLARAGSDPLRQVRTARAFNAALRSAKSLFAHRIIRADNFKVRVPKFKTHDSQVGEREIYWFENLTFEKCGSMKFSPPEGVTYQSLIVAARRELREAQPDAYLLFLLCLCAGLRRAEADVLRWEQIHYGDTTADSYIFVEANEFIEPKHGSGGQVFVEPDLLKEVLSFKARAASGFVVNSPMQFRRTVHFRYRCAPHWKVLNQWLAGKGITDHKKIQTLRKLFGDAITKTQGIFAAAAQLRHSSLQVAVKHYTDPRQRAPLSVAGLLTDKPVKDMQDAAAEEIITRLAELSPAGIAKVLAAAKKLSARRKTQAGNKVISLRQAAA